MEDRQTQPWTLSSYGHIFFLLIFYAADDVENNVNDDEPKVMCKIAHNDTKWQNLC